MDLKDYKQEHLLKYYDSLNDKDKNKLNKQLESIDFDLMNRIINTYINKNVDMSKISSLKIIRRKDATKEDSLLGEQVIKNNQYAIVLMAGGFGSRLGLNIPKGCLELNINNKNISLFELYINQIKEANKKYNSTIPLLIMTSTANTNETTKYFEEHNYFDYKENIKIFVQGDLPIVDENGKMLLKSKSEILVGPNGNGDVFNALKRNKLIDYMNNKGIKYVTFTSIDNPLSNLVDVDFIGSTINNNYSLSSKTISKKDEDDTSYIFCKNNNKPYMLSSNNITKELTNTKDKDGNYIYREKNIAYHLISIDNIESFANIDLPYHRAYRNNKYLDEDGNLITSNEANTYKFEKFIFDAFYHVDDMLLFSINEDEFSPIKRKEDIEKIELILNEKH